jgi:hypothetical protein
MKHIKNNQKSITAYGFLEIEKKNPKSRNLLVSQDPSIVAPEKVVK